VGRLILSSSSIFVLYYTYSPLQGEQRRLVWSNWYYVIVQEEMELIGRMRGRQRERMRGRIRGRIWGRIRGRIEWRIRGRIGGRIRGRIGGRMKGRIRGRTHWDPARESHSWRHFYLAITGGHTEVGIAALLYISSFFFKFLSRAYESVTKVS
jgi:hypothetical protein